MNLIRSCINLNHVISQLHGLAFGRSSEELPANAKLYTYMVVNITKCI